MASYVAPSFGAAPGTAAWTAQAAAQRTSAAARRAGFAGREYAAPADAYASFADGAASDRAYVAPSPGLSGLSARAGDALGAYVAPVAPPSMPSRDRDAGSAGAVLRAPTAAPEYVQTGRSGARYGGGEVEIPPWFEAAARKMFADRGSSSDGMSLAELTLVTSAPAQQIAASTRSAPSAAPPTPGGGQAKQTTGAGAPQIDVEKLAHEVYRQILVMMDAARARNGEPYL
jgi:hypothetical protein